MRSSALHCSARPAAIARATKQRITYSALSWRAWYG